MAPSIARSRFALLPLLALAAGCGGTGEQAVVQSGAFVGRATAVRIVIEAPGKSSRVLEFQCPDRVRIEEATTAGRLVTIAVGKRVVSRVDDLRWIRVPASFVDVPPVCDASPWNTGKTSLADDLRSLGAPGQKVQDARMEIATISRVRCRYWRANTGRDVGGTSDHLRLCLAVDDSRPMQFIFPNGGSWTFSRWNERLGISIPADAPAETAPAGP